MKIQKWLLLIMVVFMLLFACSCSDVYDETNISDVSEYNQIWNLPERRVSETSELFPGSVDGLSIDWFDCNHVTSQLVGTKWQVELTIRYDADSLSAETERLTSLCEKSVVCGNNEWLNCPAYATVWNWNSCFEYAVVNERESTISYIYLQLTDKEKLTITNDNIPHNYETEMSDIGQYSVYE